MKTAVADFITRFHDAAPSAPGVPLSLQLLSIEPLTITGEMLTAALRDCHADLHAADAELVPASHLAGQAATLVDGPPASLLGLVTWADHVIKLIGFDAPMPPGPISGTLAHSLFVPPTFRDIGRHHAAHVLLYYAGTNPDPLERFVALGCVAAALARFGCVVTLNEEARTAIPTSALLPDDGDEDMLAELRDLPVPYLYGGLTKIELTDPPGRLWFRTFANHRLGLPNLATPGRSHDQFSTTFQTFTSLLNYLRSTGLKFEIGETVRVDDDHYYTVREPKPEEWWLDSDGELLVLEIQAGGE
ncbi:MAG TPA: hypothetical protein VGJ05_06230 [Fimbriiglobus sp.]